MTTISGTRAHAPAHRPLAERDDAAEAADKPMDTPTRVMRITGAAVLGVGAAALGVKYLAALPRASKVIGAVDGVELLSNPRLGKQRFAWGVPQQGTVFGVAPKPAVSIEHVDQGALGDCWNLAGMGAIAHREPATIARMVRESSTGEHVIVALPHRTVAVSRELPIRPADGGPAYGGRLQDDPVLWPAYVEKAQAAVQPNGYRSLEGGWGRKSFELLLGTRPAPMQATQGATEEIAKAFRTNRPTVVAIDDGVASVNLHGRHAYVVTDVVGEGADTRVTLFNPWGAEHPSGPLGADVLDDVVSEVATPEYWV